MNFMEQNNGAFLVSRSIFDSGIWTMPPYYIKLWIWLIGKCNHKDTVKFGQNFERGECLITLDETQNQTKYKAGWRTEKISKFEAWNFYEWLRENNMATTTKTTVGMFVKVLNYDRYQTLKNYEANSESNAPLTHRKQTANTINKNDKNVKNVNNNILDQKFLEFWENYPRKIGKPKAEKTFKQLKEADIPLVLEGLARYNRYWLEKGTELQYIPHPVTWLNQQRWKDELDSESKTIAPVQFKTDLPPNWEPPKKTDRNLKALEEGRKKFELLKKTKLSVKSL